MATVILLGAGASHGSETISELKPPLGKDLFSELEKRNGLANKLPIELQEKFRKNFEQGMEEYYLSSNGNIMTFQREMSEYLASFKPSHSNTYIKLIKSLDCKRVIYSSLNYDLLFEVSALTLQMSVNYSSTHKPGGVRLLKLHGSSNFWPDTGTLKILQGTGFYGYGRAAIESKIKILNQPDTLLKCRTEPGLAPAIAMFAKGKKVSVCPDFVDKQYDMWVEQVTKAKKIFIVGVRVHEEDEHIWSVLGKAKGQVTYFGFAPDRCEFETWKSNHNKKNARFFETSFDDSVQQIQRMCKI